MKEVFGFIVAVVLIGCSVYVSFTIWDFVVETPKQLKRIADALERRNKDGK